MLRRARGRSTGAARLCVLAFLTYVALDFANPLMPGAVSFDQSVEGLGRPRTISLVRPDATAPMPLVAPVLTPVPPARHPPAPRIHVADPESALRPRAALALVSDASPDDD